MTTPSPRIFLENLAYKIAFLYIVQHYPTAPQTKSYRTSEWHNAGTRIIPAHQPVFMVVGTSWLKHTVLYMYTYEFYQFSYTNRKVRLFLHSIWLWEGSFDHCVKENCIATRVESKTGFEETISLITYSTSNTGTLSFSHTCSQLEYHNHNIVYTPFPPLVTSFQGLHISREHRTWGRKRNEFPLQLETSA